MYREMSLGKGIIIEVHDHSKVYFGDYMKVRLEVICRFPGRGGTRQDALDEPVLFRRELEKMAVPSAEAEATKEQLLRDFEQNVLPYLGMDGFAERLLAAQSACRRRGGPLRPVRD
jgi:hypothetical protein